MKQLYTTTLDLPSLHRFAVGFDPLFDALSRTAGSLNGTNYPPYNIVKQGENNYSVEVAVAGFEESELDVEVINGELIIKGESKREKDESTTYLHQGIASRDFIRTFALAENVEVRGATVKNGILTVLLEHVVPESAKPKKIAITFQK